MLATHAQVGVIETPVLEGRAEPVALHEHDDDLAPARGIVLGMALGAASLAAVGVLAWWAL